MDTLEKIVNCVRISPHGIIPTAIAVGLFADCAFSLGLIEHLPTALKYVELGLISLSLGVGLQYLPGSIGSYLRFKKGIRKYGFSREHVEKNLRWYCERQAYKAAAYSCGFGSEFDVINMNYEGERDYLCIPEI